MRIIASEGAEDEHKPSNSPRLIGELGKKFDCDYKILKKDITNNKIIDLYSAKRHGTKNSRSKRAFSGQLESPLATLVTVHN